MTSSRTSLGSVFATEETVAATCRRPKNIEYILLYTIFVGEHHVRRRMIAARLSSSGKLKNYACTRRAALCLWQNDNTSRWEIMRHARAAAYMDFPLDGKCRVRVNRVLTIARDFFSFLPLRVWRVLNIAGYYAEYQSFHAVHYLRMRTAREPCNNMRRAERAVPKRVSNSLIRMQIRVGTRVAQNSFRDVARPIIISIFFRADIL